VRAFIFRNFPKETPLIGAVLLMILNHPWAKGFSTLTYYSLLTLIVGSTLVVKEGLAYKWVNSRALIALGTISYSLYVWQQLFLQHPPGIRPLGALSTFPFNLIFALSAAIGSFYLLERPLIKLGHKLAAKVETVEYARV
jgi:peptidoglycan/LPS O-acetylase OafA/YrhL